MTAASAHLTRAVFDVASGAELVPTLQRIVDAARELTRARYGALGTLNDNGLHTAFVYSGVSAEQAATMGPLPAGHGLLGEITKRRAVVRAADICAHPASVGVRANHPPMTSFLGVPIVVRDKVLGNLYLTDAEGGFTAADEENLHALAAVAAVAVQSVTLLDESRRRGRRLEAAAEIAVALLSEDEPEDALELVAANARQVIEADAAVLVLPNMGNAWVIEIADGAGVDGLIGTVMPHGGRTERTVAIQRGMAIGDLSTQPDLVITGLGRFGPAIYAPMVTEGETRGVLILLRDIGGTPFEETDLVDAEAFARQAAMALELAAARRRREQSQLVEQRTEIARDLHDFVVQEIFATGAGLGALATKAEHGQFVSPDDLHQVLDRLDTAVLAVRNAIKTLREPAEPIELSARLSREISHASGQLGFTPIFDISSLAASTPLDAQLADDVAAVVREALSNVARHARARTATVSVDVIDGLLMVEICDDGIGIDPAPARRSGLGTMAERAARNDGTLAAGPAPTGRGTRVVLRVPLG